VPITPPMTNQKSYHIGPGFLAAHLTCGIPLLLLAIGFPIIGMQSPDSFFVVLSLVFGFLMLPVSLIPIFYAWYPRLRIGSEGIQVRGVVALETISILWPNVERFLWQPDKEGIVLREPLTTPAGRHLRNWARVQRNGMSQYDADQQELFAQQRYVPLRGYAYRFRQGDLLDHLRLFAPALVKDLEAQSSAYDVTRKGNRRVLAALFAFVIVVTTLLSLVGSMNWQLPTGLQALIDHCLPVATKIAFNLVALGVVVFAACNIRSAWNYLRSRQIGYAILWLALAIMQVFFALLLVILSIQ
jgi:hypothetical protein